MKKIFSILLTIAPAFAQDRYLDTVKRFADTMIEHGTDHYGAERSPLFAAMLDIQKLSLPVEQVPEEFYKSRNRQVQSTGFGLPSAPYGIRPGDRAPFGNNAEHDYSLLRALSVLSQVTGDKRYADHADAYLDFWLKHCQNPETGFMAAGEHNSWDFVRERPHANVHEVYRPSPFWDKLYRIDPYRALRIAEGIWMSQIADKKVGDYNRHAEFRTHHPSVGAAAGAAFPRHAGFYIWAFANAYVQSRDPKFIERIDLLIESRTGIRVQPWSLLVQPGSFQPAESFDPALRILLWQSAELVPPRREAWQRVVQNLDARARQHPVDIGKVPLWDLAYGQSNASSLALEQLIQYRQKADPEFLRAAAAIADSYLASGWPADTSRLWPRAAGQLISLLVSLSEETAIDPGKRKNYLEFSTAAAGKAIDLFCRNGLIRADGAANHYEAITGADDLVYALLQLHCRLHRPDIRMAPIDVNL
ncbi:MAG: hypothetical protein HY821_15740 [Acidobacteria bacterium]|nr:hypothetical protein [Acidobacteriota bacterium]